VFASENQPAENKSLRGRLVAWGFLLFALAWTGAATWLTTSDHASARTASAQDTCTLVSGIVSGLTTERRRRGYQESFSVDGVRFSFADRIINGGFHRTSARGGPIRSSPSRRLRRADGPAT
jgi:hypothetical protein